MQKILFTYQNAFSQTGGIQTFNKYFISALEDIGNENNAIKVSLVSIYDNKEDIRTHLHVTTMQKSKLTTLKYIVANAFKNDIFIFAHVNLALLAIAVRIINPKAKIIFCTHGIEIWKRLPKSTEWIMNQSTILTVSTFSKNKLLKYNRKLKDIKLFPNCIKLNKDDRKLENPYVKQEYNILSITRLSSSERLKGIDTVIKSLPQLIKDIPNIKYSVIGKGEDMKRLEQLAESLDVKKYINFLGFVEDINAYYKYCDIFTLPSKKEGFGIVYLEAMQYKKPVIAVNYGGSTDVVKNNKTGFLCTYNDKECLIEKIKILYYDIKLSNILGENSYHQLVNKFTFEIYRSRLSKILNTGVYK